MQVLDHLILQYSHVTSAINRRCKQDHSNHYQDEKYYNESPTLSKHKLVVGGWDSGQGEEALHAIPVHIFPKHVLDLHMNQEVGFAKEYEEIRAASCLDEFAAQESHKQDNQERNRYPNIVACEYRTINRAIKNNSIFQLTTPE
jgi:hypothetical protein